MSDIRNYLRVVPSAVSTGAVNMTNEQFLNELYRFAPVDHKRWTLCTNQARPEWTGKIGDPAPENPERDNYCSVATFNPDARARSSEYFAAAHVVVLDDIDPNVLALPPSYILETSPDNYQCGYLLTAPVTDQQRYNRLMKVLTRMGYGQDRSGNNTVRVVRLPVGTNSKRVHANADGEYPRCRLLQFDTNTRYSFEKLERTWVAGAEDDLPTNGEVVGMGDAEFEGLLEEISKGRDLHENINRAAARMISRGANPFDVKATLRQFMNVTPPEQRDTRWAERYDDIERSVRTAYEKFAPAVREQHEAKDQGLSQPDWEGAYVYGVDPAELEGLQPPKFLIKHWLPEKKFVLFSGHGGGGKSSVALTVSLLLSAGAEEIFGQPNEVGAIPVLYISGEDDREINLLRVRGLLRARPELDKQLMRKNLHFINAAAPEIGGTLIDLDENRLGKASFTPLFARIAKVCETLKPRLIVVDNNSITYGGNEIVRRQIQMYVTGLLRLCSDAAVLGLHHVEKAALDRDDGDGWSGSTQWHNAARARWTISKVGGEPTLWLRKSNYGRVDWHAPVIWNEQHHFHELGEFTNDSYTELREARRAAKQTEDGLVKQTNLLATLERAHANLDNDKNPRVRLHRTATNWKEALQSAGKALGFIKTGKTGLPCSVADIVTFCLNEGFLESYQLSYQERLEATQGLGSLSSWGTLPKDAAVTCYRLTNAAERPEHAI